MSIWSLNVPKKMKFLLWRIARGCLLVRTYQASNQGSGLSIINYVLFVREVLRTNGTLSGM